MSDTLTVDRLVKALEKLDEAGGPGVWADEDTVQRIFEVDPTLAEALSTGLALQAVQEALPEGWVFLGVRWTYDQWSAVIEKDEKVGYPPVRVGLGATIASAALALVDALNKEKGR